MVDRRTFLAGSAAAGFAALSGCSGITRPAVKIAVPWSGTELEAFRAVLRGLGPLGYRPVPVPLGDDIATVFDQHPANRPDVVLVPQPGLVGDNHPQLAALEEPDPWPYGDVWRSLLRLEDGKLYGIPFKVTHKSVVWYRKSQFQACGLSVPERWSEWLAVNESLVNCGVVPLALAGADGWAVTDFFENVLAGHAPDVYRTIALGSAPLYEPPQVRTALAGLGEMWAAEGALLGGVAGSLARQFADAVVQVFVHKRAAMVVAPDFADSVIHEFVDDRSDIGVFLFPAVDAGHATGSRPLVVGGDVAVVVSRGDTENARDLVNRLAAKDAPDRWITDFGGFLAARLDSRPQYSEQLTALADDIRAFNGPQDRKAVFDLSDRLGEFGGSGELGSALQDFLERVGGRGADVDLEREAERVVDELAGR